MKLSPSLSFKLCKFGKICIFHDSGVKNQFFDNTMRIYSVNYRLVHAVTRSTFKRALYTWDAKRKPNRNHSINIFKLVLAVVYLSTYRSLLSIQLPLLAIIDTRIHSANPIINSRASQKHKKAAIPTFVTLNDGLGISVSGIHDSIYRSQSVVKTLLLHVLYL